LVRNELDRVVAASDEKIDKQSIRMSEIEGLLVDHMDVSTSVQLERLDELERQMVLVQPGPNVPGASRPSASSENADGGEHSPTGGLNRTPPSMSLNPRPSGTDIPAVDSSAGETQAPGAQDSNNDGSRETESTYSTH
jgi:hypothetical protein